MLKAPVPAQEINAGVSWKLLKLGYVEAKPHPSPYKKHKSGQTVSHLFITEKGRMALLVYRKH